MLGAFLKSLFEYCSFILYHGRSRQKTKEFQQAARVGQRETHKRLQNNKHRYCPHSGRALPFGSNYYWKSSSLKDRERFECTYFYSPPQENGAVLLQHEGAQYYSRKRISRKLSEKASLDSRMAKEMERKYEGNVDPFHFPYSPLPLQGLVSIIFPDSDVFGSRLLWERSVRDDSGCSCRRDIQIIENSLHPSTYSSGKVEARRDALRLKERL